MSFVRRGLHIEGRLSLMITPIDISTTRGMIVDRRMMYSVGKGFVGFSPSGWLTSAVDCVVVLVRVVSVGSGVESVSGEVLSTCNDDQLHLPRSSAISPCLK